MLFLTNSFSTGGVETHILSLAEALVKRGYFVAVASAGGTLESELTKRGILHIYLPLNARRADHLILARRLLIQAVKEYRFDILHAHSRLAAFVVSLLPRALRPHFVTTAHLDFKVTPITRKLSRWGEKTLAVSEDIRAYLAREYALPFRKITLTVNGIDTDRFFRKQAFRTGKEKIILHISRMDDDRAKTAFLLCDALPFIRKQHSVKLVLVGGGTLLPALKARVEKDVAIKDATLVVGEAADVLPFLDKADLFVGVSRAALEAMSVSIPTILSGNSGYLGIYQSEMLPKAAASNFCCRDAQMPTADLLRRDILRLLDDESLYQKAAEDCRQTVLSHYSLNKMANDYEAFYASLKEVKDDSRNLILGYHGFDNLGDDLLLKTMIKVVRSIDAEGDVSVISHNAKATREAFSVGAIDRKNLFAALKALLHSDVLYVGGGTILQKATSRRSFWYYAFWIRLAKWLGKSVVYYANGLGEFSQEEEKALKRLLQGKCVVTLRDRESYHLAKRLCDAMPPEQRPYLALTADPAFTLLPLSPLERESLFYAYRLPTNTPYFVIALSGKEKNSRQVKALLKAIVTAMEKGFVPIFLVMQPSVDESIAKSLAKWVEHLVGMQPIVVALSARAALSLIASAHFLLTSRFHAMVFAAKAETPLLCLSGSEKCKRLCYETDHVPSLLPKDFSEETLLYALAMLLADPSRFVAKREAVQRLTAHAEALPKILEAGLQSLSAKELKPLKLEKNNREI